MKLDCWIGIPVFTRKRKHLKLLLSDGEKSALGMRDKQIDQHTHVHMQAFKVRLPRSL